MLQRVEYFDSEIYTTRAYNMKISFILLLLLFYMQNSLASPLIVAHRAGTADYPENTLYAIEKAMENEANVIWLSIQLTKDEVPVLYRPSDLNTLTNGSGPVSSYTWQQLTLLDAAYHYKLQDQYIFRGRGVKIPSLQQVILSYPHTEFFLDIKSPDANPKVIAAILGKIIKETESSERVRFYSTQTEYLDALPKELNKFETRNLTRKILANAVMANDCKMPKNHSKQLSSHSDKYHAFELRRDVKVVEKFTLGRGTSRAQLVWSPQAMTCFKRNHSTKILLIGINSNEDYQIAEYLGADYVMVDSPAAARYWH